MGAHRRMLVTRDGWSVSRTCSSDRPAGGELHVYKPLRRTRPDQRWTALYGHGDHSGRMFETEDEASQFCLERGYLQVYVNERVATFKRVNREWLRLMMNIARARLLDAQDQSAVVAAADWVRQCVIRRGCYILDALKFSNGVHAMARRLRRDLYAE